MTVDTDCVTPERRWRVVFLTVRGYRTVTGLRRGHGGGWTRAVGRRIPNVPPGAAKRPPWMTEDQYEAFIKNFAMDLGAQCITAWSIGVEHLDEDQRREVLSGVAIRPM